MTERFSAEPLTERRIAQAYPLVRMVAPAVTLTDWRQRALMFLRPSDRAGLSASPRGMYAMRNAGGYIHGVFSYRVDGGQPRLLLVEHFIAFDLLARAELVGNMLDQLDALARGHGCTAIHTRFADPADTLLMLDGAIMAWFHEDGHRPVGDGLAKELG